MFEGVRRGYLLLILYTMKVIEELGTQTATNLLLEAAKEQGRVIVKEFQDVVSSKATTLGKGEEIYKSFMSDAGAEMDILERDDESVTFIVERCPFYEALLNVGIDCGVFLEGLCTNLTLPAIQETLKQLHPKLRIEPVVCKESLDEICIERLIIAKD
jgi:hypothetical protein